MFVTEKKIFNKRKIEFEILSDFLTFRDWSFDNSLNIFIFSFLKMQHISLRNCCNLKKKILNMYHKLFLIKNKKIRNTALKLRVN
jgi:hypothetical protein